MKKRILTLVLALLLALSLLPAGAMAVEEEEVEYTWDGFVCGTWEVELQYQRELQVDKAKELLGVTAFVDQVEHYVNEQLTGIIGTAPREQKSDVFGKVWIWNLQGKTEIGIFYGREDMVTVRYAYIR